MPTTRDIPFDEEYPDRPDAVREAFADITPLADLEARRRRIAEDMDRRAALANVDALARELLDTLTIAEREFLAEILMPPTVTWAGARDRLRARLLRGFAEESYKGGAS